MLLLHNGCTCTDLSVHPSNWKTVKAKTNFTWYIQYRFRDPSFKDKYPFGRQVMIKGMNCFKDLRDRQAATQVLLEDELRLLRIEGYNPITKNFNPPSEEILDFELDPNTPFVIAIEKAREKVKCSDGNLIDLKCCVRQIKKAAAKLNIDQRPISQITRRYIKALLEQCSKDIKRWSANRHNKYRTHLIRLFC